MNEKLKNLIKYLHIPSWATEPLDLFICLFFVGGRVWLKEDGPLLNSKESLAGNSRFSSLKFTEKGMFGIL